MLFFKLCCLVFFAFICNAYLPGVGPMTTYQKLQRIPLTVNSLTSARTQLPFPYYSLPYCSPERIEDMVENLGEILHGDRIENSNYEILALQFERCKLLCSKTLTVEEANLFAERIDEEYRVNWLLDNLPAATPKLKIDASGKTIPVYDQGFSVGKKGREALGGQDNQFYLHNHILMKILYNQNPDDDKISIVRFEVNTDSINFKKDSSELICSHTPEQGLLAVSDQPIEVKFTYSVIWEKKDVPWSSRWDVYLLMTDDQIHWFSITNSFMIVLFLSGMCAMIMLRTLNADLKKYRELEDQEDVQEETGWKLVHGDVFRPPQGYLLLSVFVGTGVQVFGMCLITMIFAVLGFLSPANRGALMTAMVVLFVVMGVFGGYFSSRNYKFFGGTEWKKNTLMTAFFLPGIVFFIFLILNFMLLTLRSSGAVPFGTLVALIALWFGISVPLVFLGSYFGYKKPVDDVPVRTNQIPRQIPEQVWYLKPWVSVLTGGILPFGAVFIELFFILSSIWLHQFYYLFGFLAIVFVILIITCAEISIVMIYFQLCSEDYHWWWRSFLTSGCSALYMFCYANFYFSTKLQITKAVSVMLYFGYTFIMVLTFFVFTGTIGYYASYWFVYKIYGAIKVE